MSLFSRFRWACVLRTAPAELDADGKAVGAACCRRCGIAHDWDAYWVARCGPPPDAPLLLLPSAIEQEEPAPPPPPPAGELESAFIALFGRRAGPRDPAVGRPAALDLASATATLERAAAEMAAAAAADHDGEESKARKRHHPHLHLRKSGFSDRMAGPTCPMDRATVGGRVPRLRCEVESLEAELNALTSWCGSAGTRRHRRPRWSHRPACVAAACTDGRTSSEAVSFFVAQERSRLVPWKRTQPLRRRPPNKQVSRQVRARQIKLRSSQRTRRTSKLRKAWTSAWRRLGLWPQEALKRIDKDSELQNIMIVW